MDAKIIISKLNNSESGEIKRPLKIFIIISMQLVDVFPHLYSK